MKEIEKEIIRNLCNDNIIRAKEYTKLLLQQNTTKKDELFCKQMLTVLDRPGNSLIKVPPNISSFFVMEDVSLSFNADRYYLTEREDRLVKDILKMDKVAEQLANMRISYLNSTMLYGETGTGKTTLGRYIAYKLGIPFTYFNLSMVVDSHLGETSKNIKKAFDYVKQQRCVFMLDEIDLLGTKRGFNKNDVSEIASITISLMQNLDMVSNNIVLLGGTNRLDAIDEALLRRFTLKHEVKKLDKNERALLIKKFFKDVGYSLSENEIIDMAQMDCTQAELTNAMIRFIADKCLEKYI